MESSSVRIETSLIPESVGAEIGRVVFRGVREFFSNMTPAQKEDFERWKAEYNRRKAAERREK